MPAKRVPVSAIPEVQAFETARKKLEDFQTANGTVFEEYAELAQQYNATLEQAEKVVRAQKVSCGLFDAYQPNDQFNPDKLYELVGRDDFLKFGGKIETITKFSVDRQKLKSLIDAGKLDKAVSDEVYTEGYKYKKPNPVTL